MRLSACLLPLFASLSCSAARAPVDPDAVPPIVVPAIVATYPHDPAAFTEGLLWLDGGLYESTGLEGRSDIRRVRLADGKVLQRATLPPDMFGEGIVDWGRELVSVTWRTGVGWRWDRVTLHQKSSFHYPGEGWGMTHDRNGIILSDGTADLRLLDPRTFAERGRIHVTVMGRPLRDLNELEYVRGEILANIWHTALIARIDPVTGRVKGWIDLRPLAATVTAGGPDAVLNGIAYDAKAKRVFVTGKNWPSLFEIRYH